jgi:ABC-2 type transport system permease protein
MRWRNAWIVMRKDLDEFKKQKFVIGSIVAMPIFLGVVLPLVMFVPMVTMVPLERTWDINGLLEIGTLPSNTTIPLVNQTIKDVSYEETILRHTRLRNATLTHCIIESCVIENTTITDSTIQNSSLSNSFLSNVTVIRSEGTDLDGQFILAITSDLMFTKTKPSEITQVLPMMFNMILMIFIIVPATLPTIIATYSIVGEKNNRSLEPLLATPTTDGELLTGKIFSAFLPSIGATYLAFILGVVLLDIVLIPKVGYPPLPNLTWVLSMILLAPTACLMSILACVLVSSKVSDVRAAQQLGGFIVMPVVLLMIGVLAGFIFLSPLMILIFAGFYACLDLGLFFFVKTIFNRESILTKWG